MPAKAPCCTLLSTEGVAVELPVAARWNLLLFYPRDFSPVCTRQLCHYREQWHLLEHPEMLVFAISPDQTERHAEFQRRYGFPFPLLSDPERRCFRAYGMGGIFGVGRGVVLVDPRGELRYRWHSATGLRYPTAEQLGALLKRFGAV
jgi:peroxiredoxin Q/BCP